MTQAAGSRPTTRRIDVNTTANTPPAPTASQLRTWPVALLALPAFVAIWSGWVGLGGLTGFGKVNPLPGTPLSGWELDTAITLPIGMEVYAAYALRVWLAGHLADRATRFAKWSAIGSLALGAAGQVAYHLMIAAGVTAAPWWITTVVACLPVAVLGMGAALAHLIRDPGSAVEATTPEAEPEQRPTPNKARTSSTSRAGSTAATVARLRQRHPDWTVAQIAQRAGVTDRTVRRHLNGSTADAHDAPGEEAAA
jgi:hypothetical protein